PVDGGLGWASPIGSYPKCTNGNLYGPAKVCRRPPFGPLAKGYLSSNFSEQLAHRAGYVMRCEVFSTLQRPCFCPSRKVGFLISHKDTEMLHLMHGYGTG